MIIEYVLKLDLIVTFVSLFTILLLFILDIVIPSALWIVFGVSLLIVLVTLIGLKIYKVKQNK